MTMPTPQATKTPDDDVALVFEDVPPAATGVNGGRMPKYLKILTAMLDHPGRSVRIATGVNVSQLPSAWRMSAASEGAYANVPLDHYLFESRRSPTNVNERILYGTYLPTTQTQ